jgi:hypothetical protein
MRGSVGFDTRHIDRPSWSRSELSLFQSAKASLQKQGIDVSIEFGLSDECEPWLVFVDVAGEVIAHFARLNGGYVVCVPFQDATALTASKLPTLLFRFLQAVPNCGRMRFGLT